MSDPIGEPTTTNIPAPSLATGSWLFADHISPEHLAALREMAGMTIDPTVLEINGHKHLLDQIDTNEV